MATTISNPTTLATGTSITTTSTSTATRRRCSNSNSPKRDNSDFKTTINNNNINNNSCNSSSSSTNTTSAISAVTVGKPNETKTTTNKYTIPSNTTSNNSRFIKVNRSDNEQDLRMMATAHPNTAAPTVAANPNGNVATSKLSSSSSSSNPMVVVSWIIVQITMIASIGGILFGYDLGVISSALPQLITTFHLTSQEQQVVVSILYVGGGIGASVGGVLCDSIGRKRTIIITDIIFAIGAFLLYIASSFEMIAIGRIVVGFAVAVSGIADVSYLHEIAPIHVRGAIVSVNEACISLGFLLAFCAGGYFAGNNEEEGWRAMFGISGFLAIIQLIGMLPLPESPKWLLEQGRYEESEKAYKEINNNNNTNHITYTAMSPTTSNEERKTASRKPRKLAQDIMASPMVREGYQSTNINDDSTLSNADEGYVFRSNNNSRQNLIVSTTTKQISHQEEEQSLEHHVYSNHNINGSRLSTVLLSRLQYYWNNILYLYQQICIFITTSMTQYRRQSYITLFLVITQQFCGQTNVISYAPLILAGIANNGNSNEAAAEEESSSYNHNASEFVHGWSTLSIGLVKFLVTIIVIWKIEYLGRRYLLLVGMSTIAIGLLLLSIAFAHIHPSPASEEENEENSSISFSGQMLALPGVLLVITGYSMSFGPLTWLLTSELFPTDIRGRALGASTIITYLCASLVTSTFLSAQELVGPSAVFAFYMMFTCMGIAFAYVAVPDTGGKNTKEIDENLKDMPWWKQQRNLGLVQYASFTEEGEAKIEII